VDGVNKKAAYPGWLLKLPITEDTPCMRVRQKPFRFQSRQVRIY
jgi:hypothetical protein